MIDKNFDDKENPKVDVPSVFSEFIDSLSDTEVGLPPRDGSTSEDETNNSEWEMVREKLEQISQKYGCDIDFFGNEVLGTPFALSNRLDALVVVSPNRLSAELTAAIQDNRMTQCLADELFRRIYDPEKLDFYDVEEVNELILRNIRMLEVLLFLCETKSCEMNAILAQQNEAMWADISSQALILGAFQRIVDDLDSFMKEKPERDDEKIEAKGYLNHYVDLWKNEAIKNFSKIQPQGIPMVKGFYDAAINQISKIPEDHLLARGRLIIILKRSRGFFTISLEDEAKIMINDKAYRGFMSDISMLAE